MPKLDGLSDKELLLRFAATQDRRAFERLVLRWESSLFGYLWRATGNHSAAEDLRQEVFIRVYRHARTFNPEYAFTTWLFRIVRNSLSTWRARQAQGRLRILEHDRAIAVETSGRPDPGPRERAGYAEISDEIQSALDRLSTEDRELLLMRLGMELSYREIGAVLEVPETTAKSRCYALLRRVQAMMRAAGHDPTVVSTKVL